MFCNSRTHSTVGSRTSSKRKRVCPHKPRERRTAFTLVELMVVIVIIGLLAGAVTVNVRNYMIKGKQSVAKMEIAKIRTALETFYNFKSRYPTSAEGLDVLVHPEDGDESEAWLPRVPLDPWGNPYEYNQPGRNGPYEIITYGADAAEGGKSADKDLTSDDLDEELDQ